MQNKQERAVLYCRVSTSDELQKSSLDAQQAEGIRIAEDQGWDLIKILAEQESGTNVDGRPCYQEMLRMIRNEEIDIVIVKSIDRLNRNEADWYNFLELIVKHDIRLFQVLENRFFDSTQDTLLSGIKAILAAEYSRELSKKINKAHRYRQENTHHVVLSSRTYALKSHGGVVTVDENEAKMVRRVYELTAAGYGTTTIANILFSEGYTNRNGNRLNATTITRIITNPLFKGTAVFNKRRYDFDKKKLRYTDPKEWIIVENIVPQIVSEELWEKANKIVQMKVQVPKKPYELSQSSRDYNFKGKIFCGLCNEPYYRCFVRGKGKNNRDMAKFVYRCKTYKYQGKYNGCANIFIPEEDLSAIVNEVGKQLLSDVEINVIEDAYSILECVMKEGINEKLFVGIEKEILLKEKEKYNALRINIKNNIDPSLITKVLSDIDEELCSLNERKSQIYSKMNTMKTTENRMAELRSMGVELKAMLRKRQAFEMIEKIIIYPEQIKVFINFNNLSSDICSEGILEFPTIEWIHTKNFEKQIKYNKIINLINENPEQTVKQMAASLDTPLQTVQNWILSLRRGGYIRYNRKNGRRYWEVLKLFPKA